MPVLNLDYQHCDRKRPRYVSHAQVEDHAATVRHQLLGGTDVDAITIAQLSTISGLKVNGVAFSLFVGTDNVIHDESGQPVLGICEFDPAEPDTAMISVSPAGEKSTEELVLSTLAHEMGHAFYDAPGWIVDAARGPGLFDDFDHAPRKAYRTTTHDAEHLSKPLPANESVPKKTGTDEYFSELRANEFMGSLLVPRKRMIAAIEKLAPGHGVNIHRNAPLGPGIEASGMKLSPALTNMFGHMRIEQLQRSLATIFGVNRRFIEVRMKRYAILESGGGSG